MHSTNSKHLKMNKLTTKIIFITFLALPAIFLFTPICEADLSISQFKDAPKTIYVTGIGLHPDNPNLSIKQKKLMAERAAVADGYRKILEKIGGIKVSSSTTVQNHITTNDTIKVEINGIVKGAKQTGVRHLKGGVVEVYMEIVLGKELYKMFEPYLIKSFLFNKREHYV